MAAARGTEGRRTGPPAVGPLRRHSSNIVGSCFLPGTQHCSLAVFSRAPLSATTPTAGARSRSFRPTSGRQPASPRADKFCSKDTGGHTSAEVVSEHQVLKSKLWQHLPGALSGNLIGLLHLEGRLCLEALCKCNNLCGDVSGDECGVSAAPRQCLPAVARRLLAVPRSLLAATQLFFTVPGHIQPVLSLQLWHAELLRHSVHAGTLFYSGGPRTGGACPCPLGSIMGPSGWILQS